MHPKIINYDCTSNEYYYNPSSLERNFTVDSKHFEKENSLENNKTNQPNLNLNCISNTQHEYPSISTMEFSFDSDDYLNSNPNVKVKLNLCKKRENNKDMEKVSVPDFVTKLLINSTSSSTTVRSSSLGTNN